MPVEKERDALAETEMAPTEMPRTEMPPTEDARTLATAGTQAASAGAGELAATAALVVSASGAPEEAVQITGEIPLSSADRYEVGPRIGSGGMGEVVLQIDRNIGRAVAKKMLHPEMHNSISLQRFVREARVQGQLEHPAVVPVHDFGVDDDGRLFFTMKRIRGQTLAQILERLATNDRDTELKFTRHKLLSAFVQVCLAVEYAHKRGVIHRDLKPSNIMLGDFGEVYVLDWGLAKLTRGSGAAGDSEEAPAGRVPSARASAPDMTSDGDFLGTPLYMAPEQLLARHTAVGERADVFGLGAILFEILTLEPLRRGTSLADLLADAETTSVIERPSARVPDVAAELDDLCVSALIRDPILRLGSARALADAVDRYLQGDRDLAARHTQAAELLVSARARVTASSRTRVREPELVLAMRDVLQALALSPGDVDAQKLLVALMLEGAGDLSPDATVAFSRHEEGVRKQGLRFALIAFISWVGTLPIAMIAGVRDWGLMSVILALTFSLIGITAFLLRTRSDAETSARGPALALGIFSAIVVALTSAWLGPFVLMPLCACATLMMFLVHVTPEESRWPFALLILAIAAPFAAEALHLVPAAYTFQGGEIVLHPRLLSLPEGPTISFLAYSSIAFVAFLGYFIARLRRKQHDAERQLFGQAWLLRRLFPTDGADAADRAR